MLNKAIRSILVGLAALFWGSNASADLVQMGFQGTMNEIGSCPAAGLVCGPFSGNVSIDDAQTPTPEPVTPPTVSRHSYIATGSLSLNDGTILPLTGFEAYRNDLNSGIRIDFGIGSFAYWDYPVGIVSFDTANFSEILDAWLNETPYSGVGGLGISLLDVALCNDPDCNGTIDTWGLVPIPAAVWLFGSGIVGLIAVARKKKSYLHND